MKNKLNIYLLVLGKVVVWILGIAVIIMLLMKLTDHSPTADQIMISMLGAMFAAILTFGYVFGTHMGRVERFMKESDRRFYAFARDYRKHLETMH